MIDLFQPGAYARTAGGNLEHPELHGLAVKWIAWSIQPDNGGNGDPAVWDVARAKWDQAGIQHFPWQHCHTLADIRNLISVGTRYQSPALGLNIEDVVTDQLSLVAVETLLRSWPGQIHMPTLAWVQNGQGWNVLSRCVAALEIFPDENEDSKHPEACIEHALNEGLTKVTLMLKTRNHQLSDYATVASVCRSLYTADDIPLTQAAWESWAQPQPCTKPAKPVPPPSVPLSPTAKKQVREEIVEYATLAERYEARWHYSQRRPYLGLGAAPQTYHVNDCSSYTALIFYWAGRHTSHPLSDPLGYLYSGWGNTQTAYNNLKAHQAPKDRYLVGDMAIFGTVSKTVHITVCTRAGTQQSARWTSFGREAGPETRFPVDYHPAPLLGVYRHPQLL